MTGFTFDSGRPFPRAHRGRERRSWSPERGACKRHEFIRQRPAHRARQLLPGHQFEPGAGARKLCDARDRAILATSRRILILRSKPALVAAGYRLQYQKLLARPVLLASMVFLAAAVSLRFFRFGGVQKMVLGGVTAGFLLYVGSKVIEDMSKAELLHPVAAAWSPAFVGGVVGLLALLYQEDG